LGPTRGQRITDWMHSVATEAGLDLRPGEARSGARHPPDGGLLPSRSDPTPASGWEGLGLEPLARLSLATPLDSPTGLFRLPGANLLGARSDLEAIAGVLTQYADRPATLAVYSREICRYALWCHRELGKPISSVTLPEARRFRAFLDQIPAEWIQPGPCPRHSPHWRPFRGQLDDASKRKTLTAVHVVLHQLQATGYLVGNALSGLLKRSSVAKPSMDIHRSFGEAEWALVLEQLDRVAEDPDVLLPSRVDRPMEWGDRRRLVPLARQRRLKALVRLLQVTGLRREECEQARLSHLNRVDLDQQVFYTLDVVGKGQKRRQVYVPEAIVHLVQDHLADRASAGFEDDEETASGRSRIPLISVLRSPRASGTATVSQRVVGHGAPARTHKNCGAWSAAGMHMELKRFFARCALAAPSHGLSQDRFEAASAHWLRHTFGTMLADQQTDLRTIQAAMGHANINTTAQYSKKSRDKMLRELHAGMPASMRS
jgi:integrase